jgi:hypothetical protein
MVSSMNAMGDTQGAGAHVQTYARMAGLLFLISIGVGGFGEGYAPGALIVWNDAAATVANLKANEMLHRWSFAAYMVEAACDISITLIFYVLLRPVSRALSLLSAFFGILNTATYACCQFFYFALPHLLVSEAEYLRTFTQDQIATLVLLSFKLFSYAAVFPVLFYGLCWIVRGWLIVRSGYLPALLGLLMMLGGIGFATRTITQVLAPEFSSHFMLMLIAPGGILLGLWLLVRGVNVAKWETRRETMSARP